MSEVGSAVKAPPKENKMGTMPVGKLLITMSVPMIISMMVQALYNVVDSVFVAKVSASALDAVGAAFPVQNILIGVGTGTAVGVNALLSRSLGEKKFDRANRIAENGVFLALMAYLAFLLFGFFGVDIYMNSCNVDAQTKEFGIQYLRIVCLLSFGVYFQIMFERLLQATGRTLYTMFTQGTGAIINIILDPIFIFSKGQAVFGITMPFGLGLGVAGAAYATVIGQIFAACMAVIFNVLKNKDVRLNLFRFRPDLKIIGKIYAIGVPSILMVGIGSFMTYFMQRILNGFENKMGYTIYNVYFKLQSFFFMPMFGLNNGLIPIMAYNFGAGNRKRMMKTLRLAMMAGFCFLTVGCLVMRFCAHGLLGIFEPAGCDLKSFYEVGEKALGTISLHLPIASFCIVIGSVFQALGKGINSMIVSAARQLVVLVPAAYLLSLTGKISAVWWSFPIAEMMSITVSLVLFASLYKKLIKNIPDGAAV
ncbi:MAG: MATE family efflux transporter [Ruminococcaceae bacterium]|nr:MATE family efflux transporter [Oscillospiraceae bacterium]